MARARRARAGLTVYPPSRTLEPLAFEARFIYQKKAEVSKRQYSSKAKGSNICDFSTAKNTVQPLDRSARHSLLQQLEAALCVHQLAHEP